MAAIDPVEIRCPACDEPIEIPVSVRTLARNPASPPNTVELGVQVDPGPVAAHAEVCTSLAS